MALDSFPTLQGTITVGGSTGHGPDPRPLCRPWSQQIFRNAGHGRITDSDTVPGPHKCFNNITVENTFSSTSKVPIVYHSLINVGSQKFNFSFEIM